MKQTWTDAEEDRAEACEAAFQNGGPKVYMFEGQGWYAGTKVASDLSAARTLSLAFSWQTVYARRKHGQQYRWRKCAGSWPKTTEE